MKNKLSKRIEGVCRQINVIFQNNEEERQNQIIRFAEVVSKAPNDAALEEVVRKAEESIQAGVHNAKLEILEYIGGGDA